MARGDGAILSAPNDLIGPPITGVTVSAYSTQYPGRVATNTSNGFGFDGTDFTFPGPASTGLSMGTVVDPATGYTIPYHNTNVNNMWLTNNAEPGSITYDLGDVFRLDRAWIYNYNEASGYSDRGAETTGTVEYSLDGSTWTTLASASNLPLTQASGTANLGDDGFAELDSISLDGIQAQFVRFSNLFSFPGGDNAYMGLSEVIFFEQLEPPPLTPEPSTLVLCAAGLALAGVYTARRRRAKH